MEKDDLIQGKYKILAVIGKGSYGVVYKAKNIKTNKFIAIKKIRLEEHEGISGSTLREISTLKQLNHKNVMKVDQILYQIEKKRIFLFFEFIPLDLGKYLKKSIYQKLLDKTKIKSLMKQLLEGLVHCHSRRIIHWDIKPQNLLIDPNQNQLKIADFGLARAFSIPIQPLTNEVETLWYRAPELLLGAEDYSLGVDIWAVGCIFYELFFLQPFFKGSCEIDQIFKIFQFFGTPDKNSWSNFESLPYYKKNFPKFVASDNKEIQNKLDPIEQDLLFKFLVIDSKQRISALEALNHSYFKQ